MIYLYTLKLYIMNYQDIKNEQPILRECFFAFSTEQYNEGIAKHNLEGKKIFRGIGGLYGTKEGINELMAFYEGLGDRIAKECKAQEVYNYEFGNHECSYTNDDSEAMMIVMSYFTEEECAKVKRKHAWYTIEELTARMDREVA